jgi:1,4-alpha-glucan branching enzyme
MKQILLVLMMLTSIATADDRHHHNGLKWEDTDDDDVTIAFTQQLLPDGRVRAFYICFNERDSKHSFKVSVTGPGPDGNSQTQTKTFTLGRNQFTPMVTYFFAGNVSYIVEAID